MGKGDRISYYDLNCQWARGDLSGWSRDLEQSLREKRTPGPDGLMRILAVERMRNGAFLLKGWSEVSRKVMYVELPEDAATGWLAMGGHDMPRKGPSRNPRVQARNDFIVGIRRNQPDVDDKEIAKLVREKGWPEIKPKTISEIVKRYNRENPGNEVPSKYKRGRK